MNYDFIPQSLLKKEEHFFLRIAEALVPAKGKAETCIGEIFRAITKIECHYNLNGDAIGVSSGKETCNAAARFLKEAYPEYFEKTISKIWGVENDEAYEKGIKDLKAIALYLTSHAEWAFTKNKKDMFDYYNPEEDTCSNEDF